MGAAGAGLRVTVPWVMVNVTGDSSAVRRAGSVTVVTAGVARVRQLVGVGPVRRWSNLANWTFFSWK